MLNINDYEGLQDILDNINSKEIRELVIKTLENYSTEEKIKDAIEVSKNLIFILNFDKIGETNMNVFMDCSIAAALMHNITYKYKQDKYSLMFETRDILATVNDNNGDNKILYKYVSYIATAIEQQLNKDTPCELLIPNPNTPGYQLALACSLYYNKK